MENAQEIPVRVYHERVDHLGACRCLAERLGELGTATARLAAVSHLLKWLGYAVPEWVQRPARRRSATAIGSFGGTESAFSGA